MSQKISFPGLTIFFFSSKIAVCKHWNELSDLAWRSFKRFNSKEFCWIKEKKRPDNNKWKSYLQALMRNKLLMEKILEKCGRNLTVFELSHYDDGEHGVLLKEFFDLAMDKCPNLQNINMCQLSMKKVAIIELLEPFFMKVRKCHFIIKNDKIKDENLKELFFQNNKLQILS